MDRFPCHWGIGDGSLGGGSIAGEFRGVRLGGEAEWTGEIRCLRRLVEFVLGLHISIAVFVCSVDAVTFVYELIGVGKWESCGGGKYLGM